MGTSDAGGGRCLGASNRHAAPMGTPGAGTSARTVRRLCR